jgi:hypothetical protein
MLRLENIPVVRDESDPSEGPVERVRWPAGVDAARVTLAGPGASSRGSPTPLARGPCGAAVQPRSR